MKQFIAKFGNAIDGVLSGFDRLVMRGELRALYIAKGGGIEQYLRSNHVLLKDFGKHVNEVSARLKKASLAAAVELGRVVQYVRSAGENKQDIARRIAAEQKIESGLVCVLTSVEPCMSFRAVPNGATKRLDLKLEQRKCLHLYHYYIHPTFGFMNARIQTWFPFRVQICLNGREWLSRQMDAAGIRYVRQDNCFPWIKDVEAAQTLLNEQLSTDWAEELNRVAKMLNPIHQDIFRNYGVSYYWTTHESEWAVDFRFARREDLQRLYPLLLAHALTTFESPDVLRFLGKRARLDGQVPRGFSGELFSDVKRRAEGIRIKHYIEGNSLKMYDKAYTPVGSVLRIETTINQVAPFQSYRPSETNPEGPRAWRVMRRGVADQYRRAEVSHKAVERYADALAAVDDGRRLEELIGDLQKPAQRDGRRFRALHPFGKDNMLLRAIGRGEFNLNGFRNRDLRRALHQNATDEPTVKRESARMSRQLQLLRAHGLIRKVQHTHRYMLTDFGRVVIAAISAAQRASVKELTKSAA